MAVMSSILAFSGEPCVQVLALAATTASAEIVLGTNAIFVINADQDISLKFGQSGMSAPTGVEYRIPANQQTTLDTSSFTSIRIFARTGIPAAANVYIQKLSRF